MTEGTFVRSMLGPQVSSARHSYPAFGFGSSTREQAAKVFISAEHAKLQPTKSITPGPDGYTMRSTVGPQVNGAIPSAPQWVFGAAGRLDPLSRGVNVPGPGAYEQRSSLGAQVTGLYPSQPIFGMGTSTRDNVKGVYISEHHSNSTFQGVNSPGPATYSLNAAVGRQNASTKANQPTWVFGSSKRFADPSLLRSAKLPAPGAYDAPNGVGPQFASTKRTAPLPGFGTSNRAQVAKLYVSPAHVS